ncbi:glycosyltransferase [Patescibacteria group bacterium]|nr:glycosyltransferase [Patescibacteria group bacterium]
MNKLKIALVSPYVFSVPGGVQEHCKTLQKELISRGHSVIIIAPKQFGNQNFPEKEGFHYSHPAIPIKANKSVSWLSLPVSLPETQPIKSYLRKQDFDIVHIHEPLAPFMNWSILKHSKAKNIGTFHSALVSEGKISPLMTMQKPLEPFFQERLHGRIAVSDVALRSWRNFFRRGQGIVIPNGILANDFNPERIKPFKKYLDGKVNILYLGRLDPRKGVIYLAQAFKILEEQFGSLRLIIVGKGTEYERVRNYLSNHNASEMIMLDHVSYEDKLRYYATCDIFCSPAITGESFGIVLVEAMASGKPIVASRNPGFEYCLRNYPEKDRFLVEPANPEALALALSELIKQKSLRKALGKWGLDEAKKYSWTVLADEILEYYSHILHPNTHQKQPTAIKERPVKTKPKPPAKYKRAVFVFVDGARFDVFLDLFQQGKLPNIKRHLVANGGIYKAVSSFPSATLTSILPFITGVYPGKLDISGLRWFDKRTLKMRSYVGPGGLLFAKDVGKRVKTLFDFFENSISVFGVLPNNKQSFLIDLTYDIQRVIAHFSGKYEQLDQKIRSLVQQKLRKHEFDLLFIGFQAIDHLSHIESPFSDSVLRLYENVDAAVGEIAEHLQKKNQLEETLFMIISDHGLTKTDAQNHIDLDHHLKSFFPGIQLFKNIPFFSNFTYGHKFYSGFHRLSIGARTTGKEAVNMVSGNSMSQLYFKNSPRGDWQPVLYEDMMDDHKLKKLYDYLLKLQGIEFLISKMNGGKIRIDRQDKTGTLKTGLLSHDGKKFWYENMNAGDPFGYQNLEGELSFKEILERTIDTKYPDALVGIWQLFFSKRAGDLIVTSSPEYDLRNPKYEWPINPRATHGSLVNTHTLVPFITNARCLRGKLFNYAGNNNQKDLTKGIRSVDVFAILLEELGKKIPWSYKIDGKCPE